MQFCSLSKEIINQLQTDVNKTEFVTTELLSQSQVESNVNGIIQSQKNIVFGQTISFLDYLKTTIRGNSVISALRSNYVFIVDGGGGAYSIYLFVFFIGGHPQEFKPCDAETLILPTALISLLPVEEYFDYGDFVQEPVIPDNATIVQGFFSACIPLEAILESTLDCLYEIECIQLLLNYFPNLNQVCIVEFYLHHIFSFFR